jgi:hypothetical protein
MPKNSLADFMADWDRLVKNVTTNAADLPDLTLYKAPLEQLLTKAQEGMARSKIHQGLKQEENKAVQALMDAGKEAAVKLRAAIKAHLGPRSERLIDYGMKPLRPRSKTSRKAKKPEPNNPAPASSPDPASPQS